MSRRRPASASVGHSLRVMRPCSTLEWGRRHLNRTRLGCAVAMLTIVLGAMTGCGGNEEGAVTTLRASEAVGTPEAPRTATTVEAVTATTEAVTTTTVPEW